MPPPSYLLVGAGGGVVAWQATPATLPAPSALSAGTTRVRPTDLTLSWAINDGGAATGYAVERAPDVVLSPGVFTPGPFAPVATAPRLATGYTDAALACYTPYWYRVKALDRRGESAYSPAVRVFTGGILRTIYNVAGIDLGTVSGAGDFTKPMTPTAQVMKDAGINALTSGFMGSEVYFNPDLATWQGNFHGAAGFPHYAANIVGNGFYWLATGDDLVRTRQSLDAASGVTQAWGPQAVAEAAATLAALTLPSGEFCCQAVEMCDEANAVIPPSRQPPAADVYAVTANFRAAAPRLQLGWPCDGGVNALVSAANLRPWQTLPLADYGSIYSTANAWYVPDDAGQQFTVAKGLASYVAEFAVMAQVPATPVSGLVPLGGDFGTVNADGTKTVIQGGWKPGVTLGAIWVSLAYGTTVLRGYSWDSAGAWNSRVNTGVSHTYQTGCTPQVQPVNWACMSASFNLIARLEARICGTPGPVPAWGANFVTAQRAAADGSKVLWGVNATNSPQTVPAAPAGYASATKLTVDGAATDMSPAALAGSTLQPGEVAVFWN